MRQLLRPRGFSLIELMITIVVAGILAAIAYPLYTGYTQRARRADAVKLLTVISQAQERYRSNRGTYAATLDDLGIQSASVITPNYDISIAGVGTPPDLTIGYVLTAAVKEGSAQQRDTDCARMVLTMEGAQLQQSALDSQGNVQSRVPCWAR